jgi:hypothetical protein
MKYVVDNKQMLKTLPPFISDDAHHQQNQCQNHHRHSPPGPSFASANMRTSYDFPAICIPRSTQSMSIEEIESIFNASGLGIVKKVVVKPKSHHFSDWEKIDNEHTQMTDVHYSNIYIYFRKWNTDNPMVAEYRNKLLKGKSVKVVFNAIPSPVFWRCSAARFKSDDD